jgi:hypothetical protein
MMVMTKQLIIACVLIDYIHPNIENEKYVQ